MGDAFADQYPECSNSGIGSLYGGRYSRSKKFTANHELYECSAHIDLGGMQLYAIFSGFNGGGNAAKFALNRMVYEIFQDHPITKAMTTREIGDALEQKFSNVVKRYMDLMSELLSERFILKEENTPENAVKVSEIEQKIGEGCTALIVFIMDTDVFVVNCGTAMALAITHDAENPVFRINGVLHENEDPIEMRRLTEDVGVDPRIVSKPTRAIGDLYRSHLFDEVQEFSNANSAPVIAVPDIYHRVVDDNWRYIVLISDGVVQNLRDIQVEDIPMEVYERLKEDYTVTSTAQSLVDAFARKHLDAYTREMCIPISVMVGCAGCYSKNIFRLREDHERHRRAGKIFRHISEWTIAWHVDESSSIVSNQREEMTVIFVKMLHLYETFDATSNNSTAEILSTSDAAPLEPYVDVLPKSNTDLIRKFLLKPTD